MLQCGMRSPNHRLHPAVVTELGYKTDIKMQLPAKRSAGFVAIGIDEISLRRDLITKAADKILVELHLAPVTGPDILGCDPVLL